MAGGEGEEALLSDSVLVGSAVVVGDSVEGEGSAGVPGVETGEASAGCG